MTRTYRHHPDEADKPYFVGPEERPRALWIKAFTQMKARLDCQISLERVMNFDRVQLS